jgi:hypothetical protein
MLGIAKAADPEVAEKAAALKATQSRRERAERAASVTEVGGAAQYRNNEGATDNTGVTGLVVTQPASAGMDCYTRAR